MLRVPYPDGVLMKVQASLERSYEESTEALASSLGKEDWFAGQGYSL
jgi:hypothetical protein